MNIELTRINGGGDKSTPTVQKLNVTAEQINKITENHVRLTSNNFTAAESPRWLRICTFTSSYGCSGKCVIQFYWVYRRENTVMFLFKSGWEWLETVSQFEDTRISKIRLVRHNNQPESIAYIDILIDNINNRDVFNIYTEVYVDSATAHAGNIDPTIPDDYVTTEYDIT